MRKTIIAAAAAAALTLGLSACGGSSDDKTAPIAVSTSDSTPAPDTSPAAITLPNDSDDPQLTGETLKKASAAALKATGGGRVTETELSDDRDHAYEVEVVPTGANDDVTVELDESYKVVRIDR